MFRRHTFLASFVALALLHPAAPIGAAEPQPAVALPEDREGINCVAFSPDGKRLATASAGGPVRIWNVATWKEVKLIQPETPALAVAFSHDGRLLAFGGKGGKVHVWDLDEGKEKHVLENVGDYVRAVAFAPQERLLAFAVGRKVGLSDLRGDSPRHRRSGFHRDYVNGVAFARDGKHLASASRDDDSFRLWDVTADGLVQKRVLRRSSTEAWAIAFTADSTRLIAGDGFDVWLLETAGDETKTTKVGTHGGGNADVRRVAVSPDGKVAASVAVSDGYRLWDLETGRFVVLLEEPGAFTVAFSPDGKWSATAGGKGIVRVWDVARLLGKK
jgi:WD40 repeat protein